MKRITFSKYDAELIYEWWVALNQGSPMKCFCCPPIANRLETFIGKGATERVKTLVKDNPYFEEKGGTGEAQISGDGKYVQRDGCIWKYEDGEWVKLLNANVQLN